MTALDRLLYLYDERDARIANAEREVRRRYHAAIALACEQVGAESTWAATRMEAGNVTTER